MATFFGSFPLYYYNGVLCKNITQRTVLSQQAISESSLYYDYPITEGQRPDAVAYNVYRDPYKDWLVYYANQIIDPYYGWYLDDEELNQHIITTYTSVAVAQETIRHYRVNWQSDDRKLTSVAYNALLANVKKYWEPFYSDDGTILYYVRSKLTQTYATNRIVTLTATLTSNTEGFVVGERVNQVSGNVVTASGNIMRKDARTIQVQHIEGTFAAGTLYGLQSNTTKQIGESEVTVISIVPSEESYWSPLTAYQYEIELNEARKNIRLLLPSLTERVERSHKDLLDKS